MLDKAAQLAGSALQANAGAVLAACARAYPQGGPQRLGTNPWGSTAPCRVRGGGCSWGAAAQTGMARVAGFFLPLVMVWDGAHQRRRLLKKLASSA